ncbi:BZIP transcription factor [Lasiodiplodia theobromae]|uniref:BZIP transcription factor n=1 Tax=Lasiodiplodia theobromae TaxID=45133 RepID=UPI0015C31046|nr:BZIP transcription factor [Lasiodiplodia theobromae]KAF4544050.1 BZIP transcription factor [Lasiodiplodia theobromae]
MAYPLPTDTHFETYYPPANGNPCTSHAEILAFVPTTGLGVYSTAGSFTKTISHDTGNIAVQPDSGPVGQRNPLGYAGSAEGGNNGSFLGLGCNFTGNNPISGSYTSNSPREGLISFVPPSIGGNVPQDIPSAGALLDKEKKLRRRAQNRAAQRAFRERKERYTAELEQRAKETEARWNNLQQENERLRSAITSLQAAISSL